MNGFANMRSSLTALSALWLSGCQSPYSRSRFEYHIHILFACSFKGMDLGREIARCSLCIGAGGLLSRDAPAESLDLFIGYQHQLGPSGRDMVVGWLVWSVPRTFMMSPSYSGTMIFIVFRLRLGLVVDDAIDCRFPRSSRSTGDSNCQSNRQQSIEKFWRGLAAERLHQAPPPSLS